MAANDGPIRVGIAGLGRSGWSIHCRGLESMAESYTVAAVFDRDPARRREAEERFGCAAHDSLHGILADQSLELIVVALPSNFHAEASIHALEAGKHVVCEKPMAVNVEEVDRMMEAAARAERVLTVFQNRRFEPAFMKIREVIDSGVLGRIVEIKVNAHKFSRRWDWQTLKKYGGGILRNTGAHLLDQLLDLIGDQEPEVWSHMERTLSLGDAEDHVKIVLRPPEGPVVDLEITQACAYPQEPWLVMGTRGTLAGGAGALRWRCFDPAELPARKLTEEPTPDRSYNKDAIPWKEETWEVGEAPSNVHRFYESLYGTLRRGEPLAIRPETVRRQIAVIEECSRRSAVYA